MNLNLNPTNKLVYDPYKSDVFSFGKSYFILE